MAEGEEKMETVSYLLPSLSSLCGEWFSWNWQESFGTVESAIAGFVKHHDLPTGCAAITEIDHLLELARSEKELALFLRRDLLCFVQRGREYQTWTNWLRWVQTVLRREVTLACSRRRLSPGLGTHTLHFPVDIVAWSTLRKGLRASYSVTPYGGSSPSLTEQFTCRVGQPAQTTVVSGTTTYTDTYVYSRHGMPLELLRATTGGTNRYWYQRDGLGNVVALTDVSGNVVDQYAYDRWGKPTL
jgi:hypothetical protein